MRAFSFKQIGPWLPLLLLSGFGSGCISTRYQGMTTCPVALLPTDKVLVPYLHPIPLASSVYYFRNLKKQFDKQKIPVRYAPEEEWSLKAAGIQNPVDTVYFPALRREGYTHLLLIERLSTREAEGNLNVYTAWEISQLDLPYPAARSLEGMDHQATLRFRVQALDTRTTLFAGTVRTNISPLVKQDDDGGRTLVNLGSVEMATGKALTKGVKRLFEKCK